MTDHPKPADLTDLPLQPTGSGVADAEMARLQADLAEAEAADEDGADAPTRTQA